MKYFRWSEWDTKWNLSWDNYMLYVASIPSFESEKKPEIETKDAADLF